MKQKHNLTGCCAEYIRWDMQVAKLVQYLPVSLMQITIRFSRMHSMISALYAMTGNSAKSCSSAVRLIFCVLSMLLPLSISTFSASSSASWSSKFPPPDSLIVASLLSDKNATRSGETPKALAPYFVVCNMHYALFSKLWNEVNEVSLKFKFRTDR